jgi:hypothetical protein
MNRRWLACLLLAASAACAQQNTPHAAYVYPAGARQGTTIEVTVGGQYLDGASTALFAGDGVKTEVTGFTKPLAQKDEDEIRKRLKELEQCHTNAPAKPLAKPAAAAPPNAANSTAAASDAPTCTPTPWTPADKQLQAGLRKQLDLNNRLRNAPALAQEVSLRVTIAAHAAEGNHELRLITDRGLSNPLVFLVGHLPESTHPIQFVPLAMAAGGGLPLSAQAHADATAPPETIALPTVLNGQMMPGGIDRYRFTARKGEKIVAAAMTRGLIPYMADAVPGWFQAALTLSDATGKELAYADHFRYNQEPVIELEIPADGDYVLAVRDIISRGREDFVYRIAIGQIPYVTGIFPLGERASTRARVTLDGWNLTKTEIKPAWRDPGVYSFRAGEQGWEANSTEFRVGTLPETTENKPATEAAHARRLKLPIVVNGRIENAGDTACFRFDAGDGEEIVAEVEARRLGSPLDSTLTLTDAKGKQLAFNDDAGDKSNALETQQADSLIDYHFTAQGTYFLRIADSQHSGGPDYAYRLRIGRPQPDFDVKIAPSSVNLRPGKTIAANVLLLRRDGFGGAVKLRIKDGPAGLILGGGEIPAGADAVRVTLTAPPEAMATPHRLVVEAEALIDNHTVRREATPADDYIQAFAWHEAVPAQQCLVWVVGKNRNKPLWTATANRIAIPAGGTAQYQFEIPKGLADSAIKLALNNPPDGIGIANVKQTGTTVQLTLRADAKTKPGLAGNLIVDASAAKNGNKPYSLDTLPAIPFTVVQPQR